MSLIEEALRRIKDPLLSPEEPLPASPPPAPKIPPPAQPAPAHSWTPAPPAPAGGQAPQPTQATHLLIAVSLVVLVLAAGLIAGGVFWMGRTMTRTAVALTLPADSPVSITTSTPITVTPPESSRQSRAGEAPTTPSQAATPSSAQDVARAIQGITPAAMPTAARSGWASDDSAGPWPSEQDLSLTGVVVGEGEPYAVINGAILSVGDTTADATVVKIKEGEVTLRRADGSTLALRMSR